MVPEKKENQLRRSRDENECQPVIQADAALENGFGEASHPNAGMQMRAAPTFKNPVDSIADFRPFRLRLGADFFQQILSDSCL